MPLIHRRVQQDVPHNHAVQFHHIVKYVHPTRLRTGDKEIPLHEISDRQLADLAYFYPDEYLAPCRERGVTPTIPPAVDDESQPDFDESKPLPVRRVPRFGARPAPAPVEIEEDEDEFEEALDAPDELEPAPAASIALDEAQETFLSLNAKTAIACIEQNRERGAFLGKCYQAEKARVGGARKTVLSAFTAAGVGAEE